ncbi:MAG: carboxypeptidase regulatory-like domain-containing protein [Rubricoccaceae bacterium]|nr:carboxypeptidase regulatory-like domain-containing protein [Rubricoccaceae bacterium]
MPKLPTVAPLRLRLAALVSPAVVAAALLMLPGCDAVEPAGVLVSGTVTNSHSRPIPGATVSFDALDEEAATYVSATADAEGRFSAEVPPGSYTYVVAADGYDPLGRTVVVEASGSASLDQVLTGAGTLSTRFVSALTGEGAADVELRCVRRRADGSFPDLADVYDFSATSDIEGEMQVTGAPAGVLRCLAEGPEFDPRLFDITVRRDGVTELPPFVVTPPPPEGALRIVLTWGASPNDLDSHITGPDGDGGRFHVYWVERSYGLTNLDVDDVTSFGPETITVFPPAAGMFRYSVHNWSDQSPSGSQGLSSSPARVEVHDASGLVCTFKAPPAVQAGNTWRVFEVEARDTGGALAFDAPCARNAVDLPGLGYVSAAGADDLGAFLTSPPPKPSGS